MSAGPLVSVILPTYNHGRYLAEALNSALAQAVRGQEIIVIDDGSTDATAQVAARFGGAIRYRYQPQAGIGAARNSGLALAQGDFIAFLDADDLWVPGKLALQLAAFAADPALDLVFGQVEHFISPELPPPSAARLHCPAGLMPGVAPCGMLARRAAFAQVGPFATEWRVGEFINWYLRATESGLRSLVLPELVYRRRLHTANQGIRERANSTDLLHILKRSLDRRRATSATGATPGSH